MRLVGAVGATVPSPVVEGAVVPSVQGLPTRLPGPAVVPTDMPFWLKQVFAAFAAQAEIRVVIVTIDMTPSLGAKALRGQGRIATLISTILPAGTKALGGRGRIGVALSTVMPGGTKLLGGQGRIGATGAHQTLPIAVALRGRGLVGIANIVPALGGGVRTLAGRGRISAVIAAIQTSAAPSVRGYGRVGAVVQAIATGTDTKVLRAQGRISAALATTLPASGTLRGQGAVGVASRATTLQASTQTLRGQGAVAVSNLVRALNPGTQVLRGRGAVGAVVSATMLNRGVLAVANGRAQILVTILSFQPQRMNKVGQGTAGSSTAVVQGWSSDSGAPATIVSHQLVVQGTKAGATIVLSAVMQSGANNSGFIGIYKNGTLIPGASTTFPSSVATRTVTTTADVTQGDTLDVRANSAYVGRINEGTYLDVR